LLFGIDTTLLINGALTIALGCLYLFAKPNIGDRRYSKTLLLVGGLVVATLSAYFATRVTLGLALIYVVLAGAVLVRVFLNWRDVTTKSKDGSGGGY
jgi:hypothetical protein